MTKPTNPAGTDQQAGIISPLSLVIQDAARMPVHHPATGEPLLMPDGTPQSVLLAGVDSPQFRRALAARQAAAAAAPTPTDPAQAAVDEEEQREQFAVDLVAACTLDWTLLGTDGKPLAYSPDAAASLYADLRWLRQAADRYMADRRHYLGEG